MMCGIHMMKAIAAWLFSEVGKVLDKKDDVCENKDSWKTHQSEP